MFPTIKTYTKRSVAAAYFKQYFKGRTANADSKTYTNLVITSTGRLGWYSWIVSAKERRITYGKGNDIIAAPNIPNKTWYKIIQPDTTFVYQGYLFLFRYYKTTTDCGILPIHIVNNVKYVQNLPEDKELNFSLYAVKNETGQIVNYAWAAFENNQLVVQYPVFQDELVNYNLKQVHFELVSYDEEFTFAGARWYTCTESSYLAIGQLPLSRKTMVSA